MGWRSLGATTGLAAIRVASLLVGAVIGAGFASGREIVTFFDPLGHDAPLAVAVAAGVLGVGGYAVARVAGGRGALSYGTVFSATAGPRAGPIIDALVTAFLFLTMGVTLAGGAALVSSQYRIPVVAALAFVAAAGCALTCRGAGALLRVSPAVTPPLVVALLVIAYCTLAAPPGDAGALLSEVLPAPAGAAALRAGRALSSPPTGLAAAIASGALYGAYNLILAVGVLVAGTRYESPSGTALGGLTGGAALGGLAFAVLSACRHAGPRALSAAIPVAELACCLGPLGRHVYTVTLLLAALTTLTAAAMSISERVTAVSRATSRPGLSAPAVIALAAVPALAGFANLVKLVYPPMGLLGLAWLALLVCSRGSGAGTASS